MFLWFQGYDDGYDGEYDDESYEAYDDNYSNQSKRYIFPLLLDLHFVTALIANYTKWYCRNSSNRFFPCDSVSEYYEYGHGNNDDTYNNYGKDLIYSPFVATWQHRFSFLRARKCPVMNILNENHPLNIALVHVADRSWHIARTSKKPLLPHLFSILLLNVSQLKCKKKQLVCQLLNHQGPGHSSSHFTLLVCPGAGFEMHLKSWTKASRELEACWCPPRE